MEVDFLVFSFKNMVVYNCGHSLTGKGNTAVSLEVISSFETKLQVANYSRISLLQCNSFLFYAVFVQVHP